jgi:hypothetical protein
LTARTRSGYWALPSEFDGVTSEEFQQIVKARQNQKSALEFGVALGAFPDASGLSRVPITIELPALAATFKETGLSRVASLSIIGLLRDEDGGVLTRVGVPVNVSATPEEFEALRNGSLGFTNVIEVPPGRYSFEVLVRDENSGNAALRNYSLSVPALGTALASSSLVLGSKVEPARAASEDDCLRFGNLKVLPSARRQFRNGDNLVYFLRIYNAVLSQDKRANVEVRASLERAGSGHVTKLPAVGIHHVISDPNPHVPVARYVSLNGLASGRYFLALEIEDLASHQVTRTRTSFEIVPDAEPVRR